jgi:hypothetical protein
MDLPTLLWSIRKKVTRKRWKDNIHPLAILSNGNRFIRSKKRLDIPQVKAFYYRLFVLGTVNAAKQLQSPELAMIDKIRVSWRPEFCRRSA